VTAVAALGYFVNVYAIILFSVVRTRSLESLAVGRDSLLPTGVFLLNLQMIGMLAGGVMWGMLGDKRGRLVVLFGSILLYSVANFANGFVESVGLYGWLRLIAGIGLAGELGGGITIVSELVPSARRGYATTIVTAVGVSGGIAAAVVAAAVSWRTAYILGGVMGLLLLGLRLGTHESRLFAAIEHKPIPKGDLRLIIATPRTLLRYVECILAGLPIWFVLGILVTFAPELGKALGVSTPINVGRAVSGYSIGNVIGASASGVLSQILRRRRSAIAVFMQLCAISCASLFVAMHWMPHVVYLVYGVIGVSTGYWAVLMTVAAEQFGTNIRATVVTTVPNFVRGMTVPMTFVFESVRRQLGVVKSAGIVGSVCLLLAFLAHSRLRETFARDLDFVETGGEESTGPEQMAEG